MTTDNPQNQPSQEQINDKTTQISQEIHKDDPGTETIGDRGIALSDIKTLPLHWLWPGHILRCKLTILEGEPGLGKSLFTLDLAARVTTGRPMPDGSPGKQGNVILIAPEDRAPDVIKPRVEVAGGDPSRIRLLSHVHTINPITGSERLPPFTLPVHLPTLVATIKDTRAVLVIIDPLTAVLPSGINGPTDKDIGRGLFPLAEVALTTGCAILIVHHHNKSSFSNPLLFRSGGLLSFLALVRTGLLVVHDFVLDVLKAAVAVRPSGDANANSVLFVPPTDAIGNSLVFATEATVIAVVIGGLAAVAVLVFPSAIASVQLNAAPVAASLDPSALHNAAAPSHSTLAFTSLATAAPAAPADAPTQLPVASSCDSHRDGMSSTPTATLSAQGRSDAEMARSSRVRNPWILTPGRL